SARHAPFTDFERPAQARSRLEIDLGATVENDLDEAEVLAEVEFLAATGGVDVDVLVDPRQHVDAVGPEPLVADLVGRALGPWLISGGRRRDQPYGRRRRDADRERGQSDQTDEQQRT